MEDIAPFADDQIGAAVRDVACAVSPRRWSDTCAATVIDGVEGSFTKTKAWMPRR